VTTKLYSDTVTLEFNEDKHLYFIVQADGTRTRIPSVTGMTKMIDNGKSDMLMGWAVKKAVEYLRERFPVGEALDEIQLIKLLTSAKKAHKDFKEEAGAIGTLVHGYVEKHIKRILDGGKGKAPKKPVHPGALNGANAFHAWEANNKVEYVFSERKLASIKHWYAGTLDILAVVNGKLTIVDLKTSSGVRDEYFIQTAGYNLAVEEEFGEAAESRVIVHVDKTNGMVTPHDAETRPKLPERWKTWLEADTAAFLAAREIHHWAKGL
jgi:hypothetical protein